MKKQEKEQKPTKKAKKISDENYSCADPQGSYTGKTKNKDERPVQDADDL